MKKLLYLLLLPIWFACNEPGQPAQISFGAAAQPVFPQLSQLKKSGEILLYNVKDSVIDYLFIGSDGYGVKGDRCKNIRIKYLVVNSYETGVYFTNSDSIRIEYLLVINARSGVYFRHSSNIYIDNIEVVNPTSRTRDPEFENRNYTWLGQAVQLDKCTGSFYIGEVRGEAFEDDYYNVEDWINIYNNENSEGAGVVEYCLLRGGKSPSGGGILVGDQGASNIEVRYNKTFNVGNYSFAVAGGKNNYVHDNMAYQSQKSFVREAFYVWNQTKKECSGIVMKNNYANVTNLEGTLKYLWWLPKYQEDGFAPNCTGNIEVPKYISKEAIQFPYKLITFVTDAQLYALRKGLPLPNEGALPVTWGEIKFTGRDTLLFTTVSEENNKGFEVEESRDNGITYESIKSLPAKGPSTYKVRLKPDYKSVGGGGCASPTQERVNTRKVYRIKQVDNDGKYSYSKNLTIVR